MSEKVSINLKALAIKWRSKKKLYNVLLNDCGVYMHPIQDANAGYVGGVMTGSMKAGVGNEEQSNYFSLWRSRILN